MTKNKEMGWERDASIMHTSLQGQQDIYCHFKNGEKKTRRLD